MKIVSIPSAAIEIYMILPFVELPLYGSVFVNFTIVLLQLKTTHTLYMQEYAYQISSCFKRRYSILPTMHFFQWAFCVDGRVDR